VASESTISYMVVDDRFGKSDQVIGGPIVPTEHLQIRDATCLSAATYDRRDAEVSGITSFRSDFATEKYRLQKVYLIGNVELIVG
jgi:hypothetical protein